MRRRLDLAIRGPLARAELPGLCARLAALLDGGAPRTVVCDVSGVDPDAVLVDALARLQVTARAHGGEVQVRDASPALRDLVTFMGLEEVLRPAG